MEIAKRFHEIGYNLLATAGTAQSLAEQNIPVQVVNKIDSEDYNLLDIIRQGKAQFVINTLTKANNQRVMVSAFAVNQ